MDTCATFKEKKKKTHNPSCPAHPWCAAITLKPKTADLKFLHAVYRRPAMETLFCGRATILHLEPLLGILCV